MNILILTSIYPGNGLSNSYTSVVHYFAREWVKQGYNIKVIHSVNYFPSIYYHFPKYIKNMVMKKVGFTLPEKRITNIENYILDGVDVFRIPIFKLIPMGSYKQKDLDSQVNKITTLLKDVNFIPNFIISHWANPQLYLSAKLKNIFNCKTSLVIHERIRHYKLFKNYERLIQQIDYWGYRSIFNKDEFESNFIFKPNWFRCYSGIPSAFLENLKERTGNTFNRLIFVGQLIPRKYPDLIISAANECFLDKDFTIKIIGNGPLENKLTSLTNKYALNEKVKLLGRLSRNEIIKYLDNSDIFIMISRGEVFGLVYIEAMARGCIVVAAKGEGMEGIITSGKNGFLCEAGNQKSLEETIKYISNLSAHDRLKIIKNGYETAKSLTDINVAKQYLGHILDNATCRGSGPR